MPIFLFTALFIVSLMMASIELGRRLRLRMHEKKLSSGLGVIEAAVFGLMSLLLAFSFSGAISRFDARRELIVQETNAIGTAWLRVDLLPEAAQPQIRDDFRAYLDARLAFYKHMNSDRAKALDERALSEKLQKKIWTESVAAAQQTSSSAVLTLVVGSLNEMIDITTTRFVAQQTHPPTPIYVALVLLALLSSLIAGFDMGDTDKRAWLHTMVFAAALALTVYTIIDLEFPRAGIIRVDRYDQALVNQRNSMN
jgi:uncharacterized membrane protein YbhN (UPF0104 family)